MTKVTMPEPVARLYAEGSMRTVVWLDAGCDLPEGEHTIITATQAEAYKDACVREALEQAAHIIEANAAGCNETTFYILHSQAQAIRALLPSTPAQLAAKQ